MKALLAESEARFRTLFENASDGILIFDGRKIIADANPMMLRLLGRPLDEIRGREVTALLHPDDRNAAGRRLSGLREGEIITFEHRLQSANGGYVRVEQSVRCLHADLHLALCRDLAARDMSEKKLLATLRSAEASETQLEEAIGRVSAMATEAEVASMEMDQIFNATSDGICVIGKDFRITKCNRVLRETMEPLGFRLDRDRCHRVFGHPLCENERCLMRRILSGDGDRIEDEVDIVSAGRPTRTFIVSARPLMDLTGDTVGIVESYRDITERKQIERELRRLAVTDPLTGAFNRRRFMQRAQEEMDRSRRYRTDLTLLMLDIDHFKSINDTHGHDAGDAVLKRMVAECAAQLRGTDVFCRLGGEEFAAILT
ncbi:MAG TPA: diguanylate cyclase, partial [Desulfosarcina sp.]|nr:diguanylate cyclase [Desulfosarcina sp.]